MLHTQRLSRTVLQSRHINTAAVGLRSRIRFDWQLRSTVPPSIGYITEQTEWTFDDDDNNRKKSDPSSSSINSTPKDASSTRPTPQRPKAAAQAPQIITRIPEQLTRVIMSNALLLVDKPPLWDGKETLNAVKYALKLRYVGHAGALDPMATGLVIITLGSACKVAQMFAPMPRTYTGTLRLGMSTTTYNADGKPVLTMPWKHITDEMLQDATSAFQGEILQVPPMWSGVKVAGKPLYKYAERGETIELAPRPAFVKSFTVWRHDPTSHDVHFELIAGPNTNPRALIHDFGISLGSAAHVVSLRREAIGDFHVENAWTMDVLLPLMKKYEKLYRASPAPQPVSRMRIVKRRGKNQMYMR